MAWQRITIPIPEEFGPEERIAIGKEIVEHIRERTERGVGVKESRGSFRLYDFPAYAKSYVESLDFKVAGKSRKVNLTLSGDMLIALDVLNHKPGAITVGFERGSEENDRAEGNILGSYGGSPNPRRARNLLGITDQELDEILGRFS